MIYILIQVLLLVIQFFLAILQEEMLKPHPYVVTSLILAICSIFIYLISRKNTNLRRNTISNSFILLIMLFVVNLQAPIDFILNNDINYSKYFYNLKAIGLLTSFSSSLIIAYCLGSTFAFVNKIRGKKNQNEIQSDSYKVRTKPILIFTLLLFVCSLLFINKGYINGGHGTVLADPLFLSLFGLYNKIAIIYLGLVYYNNQNLKIRALVNKISPLFILTVVISCIIFLMAHNRVYVLFIATPFLMLLIKIGNYKIGLISFLIVLVSIGSLATIFKIYDIEKLLTDPIESLSSFAILAENGYTMLYSFSPFTAELAGSVYSSSIMFELYYKNNYFLWGSCLIIGVLKIFPGAISILLSLTNIKLWDIDPGIYITKFTNASYGLGSNLMSEMLINFGYPLSIIVFIIIGYKISKVDIDIFRNNKLNLNTIVVWLAIASQVIFLARGTLSDFIGFVGFCYLFVLLYPRIKGVKYV